MWGHTNVPVRDASNYSTRIILENYIYIMPCVRRWLEYMYAHVHACANIAIARRKCYKRFGTHVCETEWWQNDAWGGGVVRCGGVSEYPGGAEIY